MPEQITVELKGINKEMFMDKDVVFVCVGTDRSTGDSLGPLVGMYLEKLGYDVIGTIDELCHGTNLQDRIKEIPEGKTVIAIDACLGQLSRVGTVTFSKGSLRPGSGVDKDLGEVGHFNIKGIVNIGGFMEYFVLQNTPLSRVMKMAERIVMEIVQLFPVNKMQVAASMEAPNEANRS